MKLTRLVSLAVLGIALVAAPVYAQRGGGGSRGGGGGSHSSGGSVSRGGGGSHSSGSVSRGGGSSSRSTASYGGSRSSSYGGGRPVSSGVSSSSSYRSDPSSGSYSRSSSHAGYSRSGSSAGYSRSASRGYSRSSAPSRSGVGSPAAASASRSSYGGRSRTGSVPDQIRSRSAQSSAVRGNTPTRGTGRVAGRAEGTSANGAVSGRPSGTPAQPHAPQPGYGMPGHPGPMPPSHRPMHPAPYFWHPCYGCMVHCHLLYWDPFIPRPFYWPGFWLYCDNYWYDYHVSDIVVVREYAHENYGIDLISYAMSGDYMYALVNDPDGHTYIQIYDKEDKLVAEQQVSRKYCKMEVDQQNGGCWIMKKHDKDPLLFFYTPEDGKLLIYEADK